MATRFSWILLLLTACLVRPVPAADAAPILNVLNGDYADPSIVRDGDDFYMTNSSYDYFPGLLIWHSRDLKHWEPLTYALNKPMKAVWAPDFIQYRGLFYIYFPNAGRITVVTAKNPAGPWSDPIDLGLPPGLIDPGHIATPDGRRYLHFNGGRAIELTEDGLAARGEITQVYDGWPIPNDWVIESFALESPKLLYRNDYYYMTPAQGGTAGPSTSHMVVSSRSRSPLGPWEHSPHNPIVRTWDKSEQWWSKGHGTIFDDPQGNWHVVYHGYEHGQYPMGRQTLIEPVVWDNDGWFRLARDPKVEPPTENFHNVQVVNDDFAGDRLNLQWQFTGVDSSEDYRLAEGALTMNTLADRMRVMHAIVGDPSYEAVVELEPQGNVEAGLIVYYNAQTYAGIGRDAEGKLFLILKGKRFDGVAPVAPEARFLKLRLDRYDLSVAYSTDGQAWTMIPHAWEVSGYHHNMLGDFRSLKIGIYGQGEGAVTIKAFRFTPLNE